MSHNDILMNEDIKSSQVLLILNDGEKYGETSLSNAIRIAKEKGMDLVQVSSGEDVPVCKVEDYGKIKYRQSKKKKPNTIKVKTVKVNTVADDNDLERKLDRIADFLDQGHKVKYVVRQVGREHSAVDFLNSSMKRFEDIATYGNVGNQGREATVMMSPR